MTNIVTINTDASYHPVFKVGAYAFWIVYQGQRLIQSGPLKECRDSHDAECMALANALYALYKSEFAGVKYIVVNTDCQHALWAIRDNNKKFYKNSEKTVKIARKFLNDLKEKYKPGPRKYRKTAFVSWRYVKAHSDGETARLWVNNWLDKAAKQAIGEGIKAKELKKARD